MPSTSLKPSHRISTTTFQAGVMLQEVKWQSRGHTASRDLKPAGLTSKPRTWSSCLLTRTGVHSRWFPLHHCFSTGDRVVLQGTLGHVRRSPCFSQLWGRRGPNWRPGKLLTSLQCTGKPLNYLAPNVHSVKAERVCTMQRPWAITPTAPWLSPWESRNSTWFSYIFAQCPGQNSSGSEQVCGEFLPFCVAPGYVNSHLNSCSRSQFHGGERSTTFSLRGAVKISLYREQ